MHDFYTALNIISKKIFEPNHLMVSAVQEEQNSKYGAGIFQLASKTVRFRVAKTTPTKSGQFVAFWEKNKQNENQPFAYETAPDLLAITTFTETGHFGQFIFPKEVLLRQNILKSHTTKGKMAIRVYPAWDQPASKIALKTQRWQLPYFLDLSDPGTNAEERIKELYLS